MSDTIKTPKHKIIDNATNAVGGKEVCDPKAPCQPCKRADLQLLVVTPSVVPKKYESALKDAGYAWAPSFDAEFGAIKREATVPVARIMRQGYVYLYYLHRARWDVWQVMSNGLTRKIMNQVNGEQYKARQSAFGAADAPKLCGQGAANVPAHLISVSGATTTDKLWLAYSSTLWTPDTLQRYADNPQVDVPGSDGKPAGKKKLRDLRGREVSPKGILDGQFPTSGCMPLNTAALEHNVADYVKQARSDYKKAFDITLTPLAEARIGSAENFDKAVRAVERASGPSANPDLYLNKSLILMLPDAEGIADVHNSIRIKTISERQGWMAGGPDANGSNTDPNRPWERQSLLHAGYIRDWVQKSEYDRHEKKLSSDAHTIITNLEYHKIKEREIATGQRVHPPGTIYEIVGNEPGNRLYKVILPEKDFKQEVDSRTKSSVTRKVDRYNEHLDWGKIDAANKKWLEQETGWAKLLEARDSDYVTWLKSPVFQTTVQYDFDDRTAISKTARTREELQVDVHEAAARLRTMAVCYGGGACSEVSLKYFIEQFKKEAADKTHHFAQALFNEFDLLDKAAKDAGVQADLYDAVTAKRDVWSQFKEAWQQVREQAAASTSTLLLVSEQITQRMREMALLPALATQRGLQVALADAASRQVIWARAAGFASFLETGQRQYVVGVKWKAGAFAAAATETTLQGPAVDVAPRDVTGKQARRVARQTRAELKPILARNSADIDTTVMLVLDETKLAQIARARGENMLEIVSPGLFGTPQGVVRVPESMARDIVRDYTRTGGQAFKTSASWLNIGAFILQSYALRQSWEDLAKKGGLEQRDALFSMIGSVAGVTGAMTEIGALLLAPIEKTTAGTPVAAVLNKIPAHLWLRYAAGITLAAGAGFDSAVAVCKALNKTALGDTDSSNAYIGTAFVQGTSTISLALGAFYAHRARVLQHYGQQAMMRLFASAFTPIQLARCFTGVGLLLWIGGLGISFYAMYLEDDDNELFLRRTYFGKGHPQLGKFNDLGHEMQSFGALSIGARAEMEWHDDWGPDEVVVNIKLFKPEPTTIVTVLLQGFDEINGKKVADLYSGELPAHKLSSDKSEAANDIHTSEYKLKLPDGVDAVKLHYSAYKDRTRGAQPFARGEMWVED